MTTSPATALRNLVNRDRMDVAKYPELQSWRLHIGPLPRTQIRGGTSERGVYDTLTFIDTGGAPSHPTLLLDYPTVQVCQRSGSPVYTDAPLRAVKDILLGRTPGFPVDIDGNEDGTLWIAAINLQSDIMFLGEDENGRKEFSINFALITEPTPRVPGEGYRIPLPTADAA